MKIQFTLLLLLACTLGCSINKLLKNKRDEAALKVAKIQVVKLEGALQSFTVDLGRYPTSSEGLEALVHNPRNLDAWNGPYLTETTVPLDPWGKPYAYRCPGQHGDFDLFSYGPDGIEGSGDDVCSWK